MTTEKITKEEALEKIEELKKYVGEIDKKKEEKVLGIAIKNRLGEIIFQSTKTVFKEAVVEGKSNLSGADLSGADLSGANLSDADLSDADLSDADLSDADLSGAELQNAKFLGKGGTTRIKESQLGDFLKALGIVMEK